MKKKDGKIGEPSGVLRLPAQHVWTIVESSLFLSLALFETCEPGAGGVNARRRQHGRDPDRSHKRLSLAVARRGLDHSETRIHYGMVPLAANRNGGCLRAYLSDDSV